MVFGINELRERVAKLEGIVKELANEIESLRTKLNAFIGSKHYAVITGFLSEGDFEKMVNICIDISKKDKEFVFAGDPINMLVYLFDIDPDKLHKRCSWLINKTGIENLKYRVY